MISGLRMGQRVSIQSERFDLIVVGTGFASSFFLQRYLAKSGESVRVLVLERGEIRPHRWQLDGGRALMEEEAVESYTNLTPEKPWVFLNSFGGGSNCWTANSPRMLPEDFRLRTLYGVGDDWPVSYEELEPFYAETEALMAVSGPEDESPSPRSRPFPLPPHRMSDVDLLFKRAYPEHFFHMPTARPSQPVPKRPLCCMNGVCRLCPIDSKFTILNEMEHLYRDPRVSLVTGAAVQAVDVEGGRTATGVRYLRDGALHAARGDLVVLGANGLFNPHILLRSGLDGPELGKGLVEQVSKAVVVHLDGVENFGGSTMITGIGYMLYGGPHRAHRAAALIETSNKPVLRNERGKWRQRLHMHVVYEDLRQPENRVGVSDVDPVQPTTFFAGHSAYARRGMDHLEADMERILAPLPVEEIFVEAWPNPTESHIQGTTVMGDDPRRSVVDRHLIHHQVRNLMVLGSSVFPTAAPANPTLTLAALALRAAEHVT